jgi:hypothetical protein
LSSLSNVFVLSFNGLVSYYYYCSFGFELSTIGVGFAFSRGIGLAEG